MRSAILDTTIYICRWERGLYEEALAAVRKASVIRHLAVVLPELRRGARTRDAQRLVDALYRLVRIRWEPSAEDWWEAGKVIRKVGDAQSWDKNKRRDFQKDALIPLTARRHGATVVTANRADFELLSGEIGVSVLPV